VPTITSFSASPATIGPGATATLTGVFPSGTGVITPGPLQAPSGTGVQVTPTATTTYTLTVTSAEGGTATKTTTVTVNTTSDPTITSFIANPSAIPLGGSSTLTGVFSNGTGMITPGNLPATSGIGVPVRPTTTTPYTLTVTKTNYLPATQTATVTVSATAPGSLDNGFGTSGIAATTVGSLNDDIVNAVAIQPLDGKILLAGYSKVSSTENEFSLVRLNTDGTLDSNFGGGGKVLIPIGTKIDEAEAVVVQPSDGKILLAGYTQVSTTQKEFALVRLDTDGTLDTTFNTTGKVTKAIGSTDDEAEAVVVQPDGKIVVAGFTTSGGVMKIALARYTAAGAPDTGFGTNGLVVTAAGTDGSVANALALQSNGSIVAGGWAANVSTTSAFVVVRYNTDGSLDHTFDTTGIAVTAVGTAYNSGLACAIQPSDGKILLAGGAYQNSNLGQFALARYNTDGSLDTSFGSNGTGTVTTPIGTLFDMIYGIAVQSDGKIVAAGATETSSGVYEVALARYGTDGTLDSTFGEAGKTVTLVGSYGVWGSELGVALQSNGDIVVGASEAISSSTYEFAALRYLP
jgi:uncharacterized delta-60 repeat protein